MVSKAKVFQITTTQVLISELMAKVTCHQDQDCNFLNVSGLALLCWRQHVKGLAWPEYQYVARDRILSCA